MTKNPFIPQALADPASRSILFVWRDEQDFLRHWKDKVKTIDAPGVETDPRLIKVGDVIDWFCTGWNKGAVTSIEFTPDGNDIPGWCRSGHFRFAVEGCGYINARVDGRDIISSPLFVFPKTSP